VGARVTVRSTQKAAVLRYHELGMNKRDITAVLAEMSDDIRWFSVDQDFVRRWYTGNQVAAFLAAMFTNTRTLTFSVDQLLADPSVPDVVVAEWHNEAVMTDGSTYENQGCTLFAFQADTAKIREVRQYFDWGPLMARVDWRSSVRDII